MAYALLMLYLSLHEPNAHAGYASGDSPKRSHQSFANRPLPSRRLRWLSVISLTDRQLSEISTKLTSALERASCPFQLDDTMFEGKKYRGSSTRHGGQLTQLRPWSLGIHSAGSSSPAQRQLDPCTAFALVHPRNTRGWRRKLLLTARPHIGILPTKQNWAPSASALKISDPRRIPPSIAS